MAGVANHEPDIVLLGEVDSGNDVGRAGDIDRIANVVTKHAWLALICERVAALIGEIRLHH